MTHSRRMPGLAVLAVIVALTIPGPTLAATPSPVPTAQAADPNAIELAGTLRATVVDEFTTGRELTAYWLEDASGTTQLTVSGDAGRYAGARVHFNGRRQDDGTVLVSAKSVVVDKPATANPDALGPGKGPAAKAAITGTHAIAVVVAKYSNQSGYPVTLDQATQVFSGTSPSVKNFFDLTSRGRFSTTATVLGQWDLGINQCPWSFDNSMARAASVASSHGDNLSSYDHVVLWTKPPCGVTWAGVGSISGPDVQMVDDWTTGAYSEPGTSAMVASHELGHNLGLGHANGLFCTDGAGHQVTLSSTLNCDPRTYADWYSTMGIAGAANNALLDPERLRTLGWLDSNEYETVTSAGTYSIVPTYSGATGKKLLRIPRPIIVSTGTTTGAWTLEIRSDLAAADPPQGFDQLGSAPYSAAATGVTIRYSEDALSGIYAESLLVDSTPSGGTTPYFLDAPFQPGTTFTDSADGLTVHVDFVDGSGATVTIGDTAAPTPPSSLTARLVSGEGTHLTWGAATDNLGVVHYRVYRDGTLLAELSGTTLTYTDSSPDYGGPHTYSVTAVDGAGNESSPAFACARAAYVPVVPNRIIDSRSGAHLYNGSPQSFKVTERSGDPTKNVPAGAIAVTGNLTAVNESSNGYLALTPDRPAKAPSTSTINFPAGDTRANGVTVPVGAGGLLWVTFVGKSGSRADFIFDVTGYFTGSSGAATYKALTPNRILDTRSGLGGTRLVSDSAAMFHVTDQSADSTKNVPPEAVAVVGNLTAVNESSNGYFALTPDKPAARPTTSTINFPAGDARANNVIARLGAGGVLWVDFVGARGARADVLFDVTGYFVPGTSGAMFVPLTPFRLVDSRSKTGLKASLKAGTPAQFTATDSTDGHVPVGAVGIAGNLTAVSEGSRGNYALSPDKPVGKPATSTINFPWNDTRANGVTVPLATDGTLWVTFSGSGKVQGDVILDIVGYYTNS